MSRFTSSTMGQYQIDTLCIDEAIQRLGRFEDMMESLFIELKEVNLSLERFNMEGKTKTISYKETFTRKLILLQMTQYLASKGLFYE